MFVITNIETFLTLTLSIFWQLGVNGYSFMVNSNGYVLYHPDLRPVVSLLELKFFCLVLTEIPRNVWMHDLEAEDQRFYLNISSAC